MITKERRILKADNGMHYEVICLACPPCSITEQQQVLIDRIALDECGRMLLVGRCSTCNNIVVSQEINLPLEMSILQSFETPKEEMN